MVPITVFGPSIRFLPDGMRSTESKVEVRKPNSSFASTRNFSAVPSLSGNKTRLHCLDERRQVLREISSFPICSCVGSTAVHSRRELDTKNSVLVDRGYNRKSVHMHALAWIFLSTALESKSDKSILHLCTSPREAWDALHAWYGPQTTGAESDHSLHLNIFNAAPGSNPLEEMGGIEDLATETRTAGLALDGYMLYTISLTLCCQILGAG